LNRVPDFLRCSRTFPRGVPFPLPPPVLACPLTSLYVPLVGKCGSSTFSARSSPQDICWTLAAPPRLFFFLRLFALPPFSTPPPVSATDAPLRVLFWMVLGASTDRRQTPFTLRFRLFFRTRLFSAVPPRSFCLLVGFSSSAFEQKGRPSQSTLPKTGFVFFEVKRLFPERALLCVPLTPTFLFDSLLCLSNCPFSHNAFFFFAEKFVKRRLVCWAPRLNVLPLPLSLSLAVSKSAADGVRDRHFPGPPLVFLRKLALLRSSGWRSLVLPPPTRCSP